MDVIEAIHGRRTIRSYRPEPVDRGLLQHVLWAAVQAPTPPVSGDSPWKLCVIDDARRLAEYGTRAKQYAREHQPPGQHWEWTERPGFLVFWNAPAVVLFCARRANPESPFDCCRAAQNMLIAAHALGLGSCWVGAPIPWLNSPGVAEELGIPAGYEAAAAPRGVRGRATDRATETTTGSAVVLKTAMTPSTVGWRLAMTQPRSLHTVKRKRQCPLLPSN